MLPLVLDLPLRFTEALNKQAREQGVFKHARGWLRGWELPAEEISRLEQLDDQEVVLCRRPLKLFIEVATATDQMPLIDGKRIFVLRVQCKPWSLDSAGALKIMRSGFPVVPDFGGTAHAYCGSTMAAAIGDLLPWYKKPQLADMLKAYIIKSRVQKAENLMLVQRYSPHLFRQGLLPGPRLLLDVLEKRKTTKEVKQAWKDLDKAAENKTSHSCWLLEQTLPCRRCTDANHGVEKWLPVSAFTSAREAADVEKRTLARGQDLVSPP